MSSTVDESGRDVPRGTSSGAEPSSSHPAAGCSSACAAIAASSALRIRAPVSGGPVMPDAAFVIPLETVIGPQSSERPAADPSTMRLRRVRHRRRPVPCSEEDLDGPIRRAHRRFDPPGPPTRTCSTRRRIASPRSSTGRCTPTRDQRRRMPSRARRCRVTCPAPSSSGGVARADGGLSSNPSCTSARISWSRIWQAGVGSTCRSCPTRRTSLSRRTGHARCSRPLGLSRPGAVAKVGVAEATHPHGARLSGIRVADGGRLNPYRFPVRVPRPSILCPANNARCVP